MSKKSKSESKSDPAASDGHGEPISRRGAIGKVAKMAGWLTVSPAIARAQGLIGVNQPVRSLAVTQSRIHTSLSDVKRRAMSDYQTSLRAFGGRLSCPIEQLMVGRSARSGLDMDVAVIGSGYGGAICTARLAQQKRPGARVCLLERGKEWIPGSFPDTFRDVLRNLRLGFRQQSFNEVQRPLGLFDFHKGDDVDVAVGSGLGGTSLLNANVAIKPDGVVFRRPGWPQRLRDHRVLDPFFDAAALELGINPTGLSSSPKMIAQRRAISRLAIPDREFFAANLAVTLDGRFLDASGKNRQGMIQRPCTMCGDCMAGCNVGAKNTLPMNYLPLAKRNGAEIYTQVETRHIEKVGDHYRLHLVAYRGHGRHAKPIHLTRTARIVVVAAGSLGSTGILMRSQDHGLAVSPTLGYRWSGNGDSLGFVRKTETAVHSGGVGAYAAANVPVGPSIQSVTRLYRHAHPEGRILIEDGSMPRAYANVLGILMQDPTIENVMVLFGMGHDGSKGRLVMKKDAVVVDWPNAKETEYRARMRKHFELVAKAHGGQYRYLQAFGSNLITVHPLGGCNMADDPKYGVTNDLGQVFDGRHGGTQASHGQAAVHEGLYVADGAVIPGSLGANPLLTISAVAERIAASIALHPRYHDVFASSLPG